MITKIRSIIAASFFEIANIFQFATACISRYARITVATLLWNKLPLFSTRDQPGLVNQSTNFSRFAGAAL
jgi:hypothetical protein